jgi:hypothetical protein
MHEEPKTVAVVQSGGVTQAEPEFIQIPDAVRFSGIGRTSLYKEISAGRIKSINLRRPGTARGRRLVHLPSLRAYLLSFSEHKEAA